MTLTVFSDIVRLSVTMTVFSDIVRFSMAFDCVF